ncbi:MULTISPECIES: anthranilate synthase component I family protein [unclassified Sphingopyxis]|jgi:anthranilate synthase component 1|uniref:anthranilate synthase component I family protein n=1 Tax=unclassified Sphingopyxis TaxID=2614943 RepID=UPI0006C41AC8|nr:MULTISPECIES: chorismate-binding protein [unclassified Sphingopyxis]USI78894.1 chorismate-binding protein [Sphingopyxis sp. USTB-05]GAO78719.1 anthranilate synthase, aminase component [Sphingopyxis sp. C-1]
MALEGRAAALEALAQGRGAVVWQRLIADIETPVSAAFKLIEPGRGDWVLESVESGETRGRYSLLGLDPDLMFEVSGDAARINRDWRTDREAFQPLATPALQALRDLVAECRFDVPDGLPKALATLVGFFAYETIGLVERIPRAPGAGLGLPDMVFVRPTTILVFDRLADELFLIAPIWPDADGAIDRMIETAQDRLDTIAARLSSVSAHAERASTDALPTDIAANPATTPAHFAEMVRTAKDYIAAGDIFQVVLSQRFSTPFDLPPFDLYRALRRINPSPFLYFLDLPGFALIGSSPEILVRVRDDEITIRPIAGTRPRGRTSAEDVENRESLLADPKERAEHLMLLDLGRNDVGRAAIGGSVAVTDSYTVEFYSHVMHIVSNVIGRIAPDKDAIDALFAGFPAGTVSGAPKVRACQIIAELEADARGPYAGGVGYFAPDGNMDSCIVLRTAIVKDGEMHVQAGAGIVADSDPAYEQRECEAKAGALFAAAREAVRLAGTPGYGQ